MSFSYGQPADKQEMIALIRSAVEQGVTLRYRRSVPSLANEELVGEALAPYRGQVAVATKFGFKPGSEEMLPTLEELGIGFVPFSPLGARLQENLGAAALELTPDDLGRLSARLEHHGARYPKHLQKLVGR